MIQSKPMPPEDVRKLLVAAAVNKTVRTRLLEGNIYGAVKFVVKKVDPTAEINLSEGDIKSLRSITSDTLADFTEACNGIGLTGERK